jgi:hypothetical protein
MKIQFYCFQDIPFLFPSSIYVLLNLIFSNKNRHRYLLLIENATHVPKYLLFPLSQLITSVSAVVLK